MKPETTNFKDKPWQEILAVALQILIDDFESRAIETSFKIVEGFRAMTTVTTSFTEDKDYLDRMGVKDEGDIAAAIVRMVSTKSEDEYYATKYGRRMIEAIVNVRCHEKGAR